PAPQRVGAACRGRYEGRSRGALPPASQRPLVPASDPRHRPVARPYVGGAGAPVTGAPRPPRPRALRPRARRPRPRPRSGRARLCRLRAAPAGLRGGRRANRWPARAAPTLPGTGLGPPGSRRGTQGPAGGDAGGRARRPRGRGVVTRGAQNLAGAASAGESVDLVASVMLALRGVADPEIPVLDVVEMGIVRDVRLQPGPPGPRLMVTITPTFSACPAMRESGNGVRRAAEAAVDAFQAGRDEEALGVEVVTELYPPWSSDDMSQAARDKLERFGIAPAPHHGGLIELALEAPVRCPRCGHPDTRLRNPFGSTLCREIRTCSACQETFERFK